MSLVCPVCDLTQFKILDSVEIGRSMSWDEQTMQRAHCSNCGERFVCLYLEQRSFNPDRDDKVSHHAYLASTVPWWLAGLVFEKPKRKRSKPWRISLGTNLFDKCRGDNAALAIRYKRTD